ncbi:alpha/beta hydrolase [Haloferax mediterranei ATCC 33500]|uniref:Alpha/beta hydrolase n=1 Tax=Haloferax mediterranei (strain ATCC 33500 / DSM 1411 / JCM 8866 / NBRC 14739 / NCIMB 2177 / R-4) TaxID=523841 RepID=I3R523_HALMT|nr:alpha/beta hydrolase [Haloferax mediterranei]AFK19333.1 putative hydrolase or acyltransferase of alpha/beta superfamily [Haloferax mediterranei ATCC 33500]AHZ21311.1 alpha/beta hydrolase [Haloferax mediterranei ATCC 33500]EMA04476.1 alpha/beta hydrolase [Haloferax mediterranei ATCC 33500]MDX5989438.1 alpha/beta hydrolase [Haloferax mediterranei ATCC 33500]QCQ75802.1 alpha/beta hydrolase [Haloferax mediterranei ATCC 33500]
MDLDYGTLDGRRPYYRFGDSDADPLFVLPGLSDAFQREEPNRGTAMILSSLFREFSDRDVWVVGRPQHLPVGSSTRDMAAGYATVIDEHDLWPTDVIGVSMGGLVAQYLAADYGDYVDSVALVSAGTRLGGHGENVMRRWRNLAGKGKWADIVAEMARESATGYEQTLAPTLLKAAGRFVDFRPVVPADAVISCTACLEHDSREILDDIDAPTIIAAGDADRLFPEPRLREAKDGIDDATLALFKGESHDLATSESRELNGILRRFFDGFRGDGLHP